MAGVGDAARAVEVCAAPPSPANYAAPLLVLNARLHGAGGGLPQNAVRTLSGSDLQRPPPTVIRCLLDSKALAETPPAVARLTLQPLRRLLNTALACQCSALQLRR